MRWSLGNGNLEDCVAILPGGYRRKVINSETDKSESFTTPVFIAIDSSKPSSNDINECELASPNIVCNTGTVCINTEGSYRCECMEGFTNIHDSYYVTSTELFCQDIDECNIDAQNIMCGTGTVCINTEGSYRCDCLEGFVRLSDPVSVSGGYYCQDIDECKQNSHGCSVYADCINYEGSFECQCMNGFYGDGFDCFDIDECHFELHNCTANNTACKNTPSSFECVCMEGFVWNGSVCIDVDECQLQIHNCSANNTVCRNLPGSYECPCSDGFVWNGSVCVEINECEVIFYPCNATSEGDCANTTGSYQCYCFDGFNKSGKLCKDIDECAIDNHYCSEHNGQCENTEGSYECHCLEGFSGTWPYCADVDECSLLTHNCPENSYCKNTLGGYQCDCFHGFTKNGLFCYDIDECAIDNHYCSEHNGQCENTEGSYECHCLDGFNGTWPYCPACPGMWSDSFELATGDTYCVVSIRMAWYDADYFCKSFGTHLAEVQNLERNTHLANIIRNLNVSAAWIGLRDIGGNWVFENGTDPTFFNWNAGEPNYMPIISYILYEENCALLHDNTYWSSENCLDIQMESICLKASDYQQP
ncbi:Fibrillin-1 [Holothuria leucospilota]|uniref:Fibrillin-1 n=1 Tax=Holothuria leucospilota TaxID=206669 RepID=A0A9Q1C2I9_HOLLE|nr:Fibrillin-1 [Holothuria leucospilota]